MDTIEILGLKLNAHIGVYPFEHYITQPLLFDITLNTDFSNCHDNIKNTLDYASICQEVEKIVSRQHFNLIETLALEIAQTLKSLFALEQIKVSVSKPHAIPNTQNIKVTTIR